MLGTGDSGRVPTFMEVTHTHSPTCVLCCIVILLQGAIRPGSKDLFTLLPEYRNGRQRLGLSRH